jgi:drug/metabolite transporter (DMT)-like permease
MEYHWAYLSFCELFITSFSLIVTKYLTSSGLSIEALIAIIYIMVGIAGVIYLINHKKDMQKIINNLTLGLIILLILACIFRVFGSVIMAKAIHLAPNISYCHLIVNLNVLVTILASYFLFNQKINLKTFVGILISLFGMSMVIYYSNE